MDRPLWQMTVEELLMELKLQSINYTPLKSQYLKEIEKEILSRIKGEEE